MDTIHSTCGVLHGRMIQLDSEPGLPDGLPVAVTFRPLAATEDWPLGEGLRRSAGAWADDVEALNEYLEWNRRQRKHCARRDG